jgi:UDP-N-acetyl-D-mannosaminuronate dehydrogenase
MFGTSLTVTRRFKLMMAQAAQRFIEKVRDRWVVIGVVGLDAVLVATDHDDVDDALIVAHAKRVVETRNTSPPAWACGRDHLQGVMAA